VRLAAKALAVRRLRLSSISFRDALAVGLPLLALVAGAFWLSYQFVRPAPPDRFVLSTGGATGAYQAFAERYREQLAAEGIEVALQPSAGAVENIERLRNMDSEVEVAFVQSGTLRPGDAGDLRSLGALFYEPVWIFHRAGRAIDKVRDLAGKRIVVGAPGSGTRDLALQILRHNEIDGPPTTLIERSAESAAEDLIAGRVDAVFIVAAPETGIVRALLHAPQVRLLSFSRALAYTRLMPFLHVVTLPHGSIDLVRDIPAEDVTLVATTAQLVVRDGFHPALVDLLMHATHAVHGGIGPLQKVGEFPSRTATDLPLDDKARRYFGSGPPFLQRYMPFWAATLVDRIIVLLVPLFAVLVPAMRFAPAIYTWRVRSNIARLYGELKLLENEIRHAYVQDQHAAYIERLDALEDSAFRRSIPLGFTDQVYILREHIGMVRMVLERLQPATHALPVARLEDRVN